MSASSIQSETTTTTTMKSDDVQRKNKFNAITGKAEPQVGTAITDPEAQGQTFTLTLLAAESPKLTCPAECNLNATQQHVPQAL